jgi:hypothetical protein
MDIALLTLILVAVCYYGYELKWLLGQHYLVMQEALTVLKAQSDKIDVLRNRTNDR